MTDVRSTGAGIKYLYCLYCIWHSLQFVRVLFVESCLSLSKLGFWPPLTYCLLFATKKRVEIDNGVEYLQRVGAGSEFNL